LLILIDELVLQTGAMKLGKDVVVLTQTSTSRSVALFSQSFNENKEVSYVALFYKKNSILNMIIISI